MRSDQKSPIHKRAILLATLLAVSSVRAQSADYWIGADLSFLKQAEERGTVFRENGEPKPGLQIFKDHGYGWVRLRLFHTPTRLPNNLEYTIALAQEAKKRGFKFLLDYHYSDTWADPGKQFIPKAWEGMSHPQLVEAVFNYTRDTMRAFREAGVLPDAVQIGNEITNGMLWPDGHLPENWDNLADLIKAGIAGVQAGRGSQKSPRIMIHIDKGGDRITTNFMTTHREVYPTLSRGDLDVMTWTIYPVHGQMNQGPLGYRLGNADAMSFMHDYMRSLNRLQGIMELQPGQVNWGEFNPWPLPGAIRMWLLRAFAGGASLICTYRYRQPLYGAELYHKGIVETDGVSPSPGGLEYIQAIKDVQLLRASRRPNAVEPREYAARRAALMYHVDNRWDLDNHKQTSRWNSMGHLLKYHTALKSLGGPVDVIDESSDFARYPFLVAPAYQLVDSQLSARWTKYAEDGGHLVLTLRTAQKDRRGHLWEGAWAQPIVDLIGDRIPTYDVLPGNLSGKVDASGKTYDWGVWGESLEPQRGTNVLATYADQYYKGDAAATTRRLGKGSVTYIGVESLAGELEKDLLRGVFERAGVAARNLPSGFYVEWRDGFWIATNFTEQTLRAPVSASAKVLIGGRDVPPAGVTVWIE